MFNDFKVGTKGHLAFVQGMKSNEKGKVSIQGVVALWKNCMVFPADQSNRFALETSNSRLFAIKMSKNAGAFGFFLFCQDIILIWWNKTEKSFSPIGCATNDQGICADILSP